MVNESVRYGVRQFGAVGLSMALSECIHSDSAMDNNNNNNNFIASFKVIINKHIWISQV
jgi:hypothetical protein